MTRRLFLLILFIVLLFPRLGNAQTDMEKHWVDSVFNSLTVEERIAQLMVVRANDPGKDYYAYIEKYISKYNIGGVCFFRNHPYHQAKTTNAWQELAKTPLLVSIDAEWGLGMRLDSTSIFPFQMTLGAISNDELIYSMGAEIADQCRRIGVHMNFAPVVDINSNPMNPVIGMRSFGQEKENVTSKGMAYMRGLQEHGVIATAKHFPGHGDTDTDSHQTLPVISHSAERLDSMELYPFRQLIDNGLGGIMIAHLYIPAYEKTEGLASTLSSNIVDAVLREELGFDGLIVTDALDMKGVTKYHKPGEIELKALMAGNDILLLPADVPKAIRHIKEALEEGKIDNSVIDTRCRKVLSYKFKAGLAEEYHVDTETLHADLNNSGAAAINRMLYEASATLVRNENGLLPLTHLDTLQIAYVSTGGGDSEDHFKERLGLYCGITNFDLDPDARDKELKNLMQELAPYNLVIVGIRNTNIYPYKNYGIEDATWSFVRQLTGEKKVVLDLFGSPYALSELATEELPEAIIISYQDNRISEEVGAEVIFGGVGVTGKLPVGITGLFEAGTSIPTRSIRMCFVEPAMLGISDSFMAQADSIALSGITMKAYPGCQVLAAKDGKIFYHKAFGHHTYNDQQSVELTDIYDLASLTKIAATTLSMMDLYGKEIIDIDEKLSKYLPYLRESNKKDIVIRELMAHQSRFLAWIPYYRYTVEQRKPNADIYHQEISEDYPIRVAEKMYIREDYYREVLDSIRFSSLRETDHYKYSDLGFYLLKEAIESICNESFESFVQKQYYEPLGLNTMGFLPLRRFDPDKIAPTENDQVFRMQLLRGDVHDQGAAMLGGVSGHAGLFSDALDMAVIMQLFLNEGEYGGRRYLKKEVVDEFTKTQFPLNLNRRGIGFDKPMFEYDEDGPTCKAASPSSYGHSGFTGTYAWADPENGLVYIFLSNRVYPNAGNTKIMDYDIRTNLHQVFYDALNTLNRN